MSVIKRLQKRRAYRHQINGEEILIRSLLTSEFDLVMEIRDDGESLGAAIGFGLLNEDQSAAFTRHPDESVKQFGQRVLRELDLPGDTRRELSEKILSLTVSGPDVDALVKK